MNHGHHDESRPTPVTRARMREVLPTLQRVTSRASRAVERRLDRLDESGEVSELAAIDAEVQRWFDDVRRLGGVPRGLWLVEFPARAGWFGWRVGDTDLALFRMYGTSPEDRAPLH